MFSFFELSLLAIQLNFNTFSNHFLRLQNQRHSFDFFHINWIFKSISLFLKRKWICSSFIQCTSFLLSTILITARCLLAFDLYLLLCVFSLFTIICLSLTIMLLRRLTWKNHVCNKQKQPAIKILKMYWILGSKSKFSLEK